MFNELYFTYYFGPKHKDATIFGNHLNPVIMVFTEKLSPSTLR